MVGVLFQYADVLVNRPEETWRQAHRKKSIQRQRYAERKY
jgi:hypothetical protein